MRLILLSIAVYFLSAPSTCTKKKQAENCFLGKLEIQADCMNYTISVLHGPNDTSLVVPQWTDPNTGKTYKYVFALGSRCNFPETIKAGDSFYFVLDNTTRDDCTVCLMHYPQPPKKLRIKVISQACDHKD